MNEGFLSGLELSFKGCEDILHGLRSRDCFRQVTLPRMQFLSGANMKQNTAMDWKLKSEEIHVCENDSL